VQVPEGIDWAKLNAYVMEKYKCVAFTTGVWHVSMLFVPDARSAGTGPALSPVEDELQALHE